MVRKLGLKFSPVKLTTSRAMLSIEGAPCARTAQCVLYGGARGVSQIVEIGQSRSACLL